MYRGDTGLPFIDDIEFYFNRVMTRMEQNMLIKELIVCTSIEERIKKINIKENERKIDPVIDFINEFSKGYDDGIRIKYIYMIIKAIHPHCLHHTPINTRFLPALGYFKNLEFVSLSSLSKLLVIDSIPSIGIPIVTDYGGLSVREKNYKDVRSFFNNYKYIPAWQRISKTTNHPFWTK